MKTKILRIFLAVFTVSFLFISYVFSLKLSVKVKIGYRHQKGI